MDAFLRTTIKRTHGSRERETCIDSNASLNDVHQTKRCLTTTLLGSVQVFILRKRRFLYSLHSPLDATGLRGRHHTNSLRKTCHSNTCGTRMSPSCEDTPIPNSQKNQEIKGAAPLRASPAGAPWQGFQEISPNDSTIKHAIAKHAG